MIKVLRLPFFVNRKYRTIAIPAPRNSNSKKLVATKLELQSLYSKGPGVIFWRQGVASVERRGRMIK